MWATVIDVETKRAKLLGDDSRLYAVPIDHLKGRRPQEADRIEVTDEYLVKNPVNDGGPFYGANSATKEGLETKGKRNGSRVGSSNYPRDCSVEATVTEDCGNFVRLL